MAAVLQVESVQPKLHKWRAFGLAVPLGSITLALLAAPVLCFFTRWEWIVGAVAYPWLGLGITVCFHRCLTHESFRFTWLGRWFVQPLLIFGGNAAFQTSWWIWAGWHLPHHMHSDKDGDPHSPARKGFWWAQGIWLAFAPKPDQEALARLSPPNLIARCMKGRWTAIIFGPVLALGIAYLAAGWVGALWYLAAAGFVWHLTSLINSLGHQHPKGYRNLGPNTKDFSTNRFLLALFTFGEGWHNNHHQSQHSAKFGRQWWEVDIGYYVIRIMQLCRLVTDVRVS